MSLVSLVNVTKHFGAHEVLEDVSFRIESGDRLALVGSNGAGKSTILRVIAGVEETDSGSVRRRRNLRIAYLPQDPYFKASDTLYEAMLDVFRDVIKAQEQLRVLEHQMSEGRAEPHLIEEYGRLQTLVEHSGYDYQEQIERVLTGLGLEQESWRQPTKMLSGGQRTRANLARILLADADLLLLDEPTNHLDIPAVEWLESYLSELKRAYLIVAHDRYLLDRVTKRTADLSNGRVAEYDAPYSRFLPLKAERLARQRQEYATQREHIAKTEEFVRRYGAGQRYKEARGRQKRLDRLERIEKPVEDEAVRLQLKGVRRSGDIVLEARDLVAGYPDKPLVSLPPEVIVRRGDRIAVIGPNGSGKSTLVRTLIGELQPLEGTVRWGAKTSIGYYSQTLGLLDEKRTALEELQKTRPVSEGEGRSFLGRFLFSGDDVFKNIGLLSGGEKSRVALAKLILEEPNVLVLDEPTNHLDIASRDALQNVLDGFSGTLLFVSHDRYLIDALAHHLWVLRDGKLFRYDGTYSDMASGRSHSLEHVAVSPARDDGHISAEQRLDDLQGEAESLASRLSEVAATTSVAQMAELLQRYEEVQRNLEETQCSWLRTVRQELHSSSA